jgi:hypothetical protein
MTTRTAITLAVIAFAVPAPAQARVAGSWQPLPAAPVAADPGVDAVWTGSDLLVVGWETRRAEDGAVLRRRAVAATYSPTSGRWRSLAPPALAGASGFASLVWTGSEAVLWGGGAHAAYVAATGRWRLLPAPPSTAHDDAGLVAWTGREVVGWGGGCCGDAFDDGAAFDPAANTWRALPTSPLAGSQHPLGAWDGRELLIVVGDRDPEGKPWPAALARAAAYDPATDRWRRLAAPPRPLRPGAAAVWDGRELLVLGGMGVRRGLAYNPATDRWRRLPPMEQGRIDAVAVRAGGRVLVWGGRTAGIRSVPSVPGHGLAYDIAGDRWSALPPAPVPGRVAPAAAWTGRQLLVWGGGDGVPAFADGAAFRPSG